MGLIRDDTSPKKRRAAVGPSIGPSIGLGSPIGPSTRPVGLSADAADPAAKKRKRESVALPSIDAKGDQCEEAEDTRQDQRQTIGPTLPPGYT